LRTWLDATAAATPTTATMRSAVQRRTGPIPIRRGEGIGRSRGGLSTKIHLAVDGRGLPMRRSSPRAKPVTTHNCCRCWMPSGSPGSDQDGRGVDRKAVLADKAYSHPRPARPASAPDQIRQPGTRRPDRPPREQGFRRGRPPAFDAELYKQRNVVERCFNRLKQFRDLATRYAKRVAYYQAELVIAAIVLWLR
jgi:transposase